MLPNIGPTEIIVVLVIALLVFGPRRVPELGRSVGKGIREFRETLSSDTEAEPKKEKASLPPG
jgi:sec-independent protein translocase protein TatA